MPTSAYVLQSLFTTILFTNWPTLEEDLIQSVILCCTVIRLINHVVEETVLKLCKPWCHYFSGVLLPSIYTALYKCNYSGGLYLVESCSWNEENSQITTIECPIGEGWRSSNLWAHFHYFDASYEFWVCSVVIIRHICICFLSFRLVNLNLRA